MVGSYIPPNPCCLASLVASTASSMEVYSFPASWWPGMKTALLLRTEMSILMVDKMSPLFQECAFFLVCIPQACKVERSSANIQKAEK